MMSDDILGEVLFWQYVKGDKQCPFLLLGKSDEEDDDGPSLFWTFCT